MLACGQNFQPTKVMREIERFDTSTLPAKVATDLGNGFIKGVTNPAGRAALVSELVAAELASWFGLRVPDFAIIPTCQIDIPMLNRGGLIEPPVFCSKEVIGETRDLGGEFLKRLRDHSDIAKLVIFDTWIRNVDRYEVESGHSNSDNILYARSDILPRKYELVPIDHSHCFSEMDLTDDVEWDVEDKNVYGLFPEFQEYLTAAHVADAIECLRTINPALVSEIVNSVPPQWHLRTAQRESLTEFICNRAVFVMETISSAILNQADLIGFENN